MTVDVAWSLFLVTSVAVIATPGQDMLLVMSRSIAQGPAAGVVTALGVGTGLLGHTLLASLGLGAVLAASETLFVAMKLAGAAYLAWLGIGLLRTRSATLEVEGAAPRTLRRLFADGALSNLSNPKIAVFYFAFLPQFVARDAAHPAPSIALLGAVFAALTVAIKAPVGVFAGAASGWLRARPRVLLWVHRFSGAVLVGLGARLALERR